MRKSFLILWNVPPEPFKLFSGGKIPQPGRILWDLPTGRKQQKFCLQVVPSCRGRFYGNSERLSRVSEYLSEDDLSVWFSRCRFLVERRNNRTEEEVLAHQARMREEMRRYREENKDEIKACEAALPPEEQKRRSNMSYLWTKKSRANRRLESPKPKHVVPDENEDHCRPGGGRG